MENAENEGGLKQSGQGLSPEPTPITERRATRFTRWSTGVAVRLFIWYALITALFRCPSNSAELDGLSPRVCQPYLAARSQLDPFVKPYYDTYAAPYVEVVQPYAHNFNKNIYTPSKSFAVRSYHSYGSPGLEQGTRFLQARWNTAVTPRLHIARDMSVQSYDSSVKPHIRQIEAIIIPRYQSAATALAHARNTHFTPYYSQIKPGIQRVYYAIHDFITNHVLPRSRQVWSIVASFVNGTLRPRITSLYFTNVEPQLVRIGKKLASYREGKDVQRVVEENQSSTDATLDSSSSSSSITEAHTQTEESTTSTHSSTSSTDDSQRDVAREQIASDLKAWQEKFASAADKGCEDLGEQTVAIVQDQVDNGSQKMGENLLSTVEAAAQNELQGLRTRITDIIRSLPEDFGQVEIDTAEDELIRALRTSGAAIRDPAHTLRQWFNDYDGKLLQRVTAAVSSTLEVLDGIRDLGLQKIGMSWAWMDGVTYKDWAKYHALKQQLSDWRDEVRDTGMQHDSLVNARAACSDILARGMVVAETTAKELARLKEVGRWKIEAGDSSDDFETKTGDPAEYRAKQRAALELERARSLEVAEGEPTTAAVNREEDIFSDDRLGSASSFEDKVSAAVKSEDAFEMPESAGPKNGYHSVEEEAAAYDQKETSDATQVWRDDSTEVPTASDSPSGDYSSEASTREADVPEGQSAQDSTRSYGSLHADVDAILGSAEDRLRSVIDSAARGIAEAHQMSQDGDGSVLDAAAADIEEVLEAAAGQLGSVIQTPADDSDDPSSSEALASKLQSAIERLHTLSEEAQTDWLSLSAKSYAEDFTSHATTTSQEESSASGTSPMDATASSIHEEL